MADIRIGFIGLGNMGSPMSKNLLQSGYSVSVYDLKESAVADLVKCGAKKCASPKDVAIASDIVILSLPNSKIIENVVLGKDGVIEGLKRGEILIDMSSAEPSSTRRISKILNEKDVDMLDAAISGGPAGAEKGTLSIMVGGDREVLNQVKPILSIFGKNIFHVGGNSSGHTLKTVNNLLYGAIFIATCEAITLGVKAGLDPQTLLEVISTSAGRNFAVDVKFKGNVLNRDFEPGFSTDLLHKDMGIALEMAKEMGFPVSLCSYARDVLTEGKLNGLGGMDHTAVVTKYEKLAGIEVKK